MNGMNGDSIRNAASKMPIRFPYAARATSRSLDASRALINSRYQSQYSPQKK